MHSEKEQLRLSLRVISDNDYKLKEHESINDYVNLMLKYIGDSDPELRDDLIYSTFANWIEGECYFTDEELKSLLNTLLSNDFIFYKIGSKVDDSVLRRSFSVLLINPILCRHLDKEFLDEEMILKTKDYLIKYFIQEKDLRGYDKEKGWVHAIAHTADGLCVLAECKEITENICEEIMTAIENKMLEGEEVFSFQEDERIVTIIYCIISNKLLSKQYICDWIEGLSKVTEIKDTMTRFKARVNIKNLIRSLYFRLLHLCNDDEISKAIIELEKKINSYLR
jgi:hypothetical protein